ncbi:MAG: hypothetical protein ABI778_12625 [Ignavibacteriota bacterium]
MKSILLILLPCLFLLVVSNSYSQIPRTFSYQGAVVDAAKVPISDGVHPVSISIYGSATGGSALYTEVASASFQRGIFSIVIGTAGVIPDSLHFDRPYFLGVAIDGGSELLPRTPVTAIPYALRASVSDQAQTIAPGAPNVVTSVNGQSGSLTLTTSGGTTVTTSGSNINIGIDNASGDLTGSYPNPTIAAGAVSGNKIADQGVGFGKISLSGAAAGEVLNFDGASVGWRKDGLTLPYSQITKATQSAIEIIDSVTFSSPGSSPLLRLDMRDTTSTRVALRITTRSHGINAIDVSTEGGGSCAVFTKSKDRFTGSGSSVFIGPVLVAESRQGSQVTAAEFNALDTGNTRPAVDIEHRGKGVGLQVDASGANIATFRRRRVTQSGSSTSTVVRFDTTGKGFFDGGTQTGGADVAEAFDVVGNVNQYEKGDVLVISTDRARQVKLSSVPYSTVVAGVYATKPGVLLTELSGEDDLSDKVPMGVIGVIPTKVCSENGPIGIGDLLVTSSLPGHAMKGKLRKIRNRPGSVLGKALDNFDGSGTGLIRVLVSVR